MPSDPNEFFIPAIEQKIINCLITDFILWCGIFVMRINIKRGNKDILEFIIFFVLRTV